MDRPFSIIIAIGTHFARALAVTGPKGVPGKELLSFAGSIPADDLKVMEQAIEANCELD